MHEDPSSGAPGTPVGDDGPEPGERIGDFVRETASALGSNTGRAVRSDLGIYAAWCAEERIAASYDQEAKWWDNEESARQRLGH